MCFGTVLISFWQSPKTSAGHCHGAGEDPICDPRLSHCLTICVLLALELCYEMCMLICYCCPAGMYVPPSCLLL